MEEADREVALGTFRGAQASRCPFPSTLAATPATLHACSWSAVSLPQLFAPLFRVLALLPRSPALSGLVRPQRQQPHVAMCLTCWCGAGSSRNPGRRERFEQRHPGAKVTAPFDAVPKGRKGAASCHLDAWDISCVGYG